jgi:hypothetical protein
MSQQSKIDAILSHPRMSDENRVEFRAWLSGPRDRNFTFDYQMGRHADRWLSVDRENLEISARTESNGEGDDDFS